jgi:hypothetical protein
MSTRTENRATPGTVRHPRLEAQHLVGEGFAAHVLEPSPPAITDGEWLADDPAVDNEPMPGQRAVYPTSREGLTWDAWLEEHPAQREWARDRWLGAYRRLPPPPIQFPETRLALHRLAAYVLSPARRRFNGKIGLRWTLGGFGTPFFGDAEQVRVDDGWIVRQRGGRASAERVTSLARAAAFALDGPPDVTWAEGLDVPAVGDPDAPLGVDGDAAAYLGDWHGFGFSVLEELRASPRSVDASRVQLWPEHFDAAFDFLRDEDRRRATFGASPGDSNVAEPYLYVIPSHFDELPASELWNARAFPGAILPLSEFVDAPDQRASALEFFRERRAVLER